MIRPAGIIALILLFSILPAQQAGKISGNIIAQDSGQPLMGANVVLIGTTLGAASDGNGDFHIINIPPGYYELKVMMIGYTSAIMKNIQVHSGLTSEHDFQLTVGAVEGESVTIIAQRALIQQDVTYSSRYLNADQIESLPTGDYTGVIAMNPGFTKDAKGFHLRGGRAGEVKFAVDGVILQEPNYGTSFSGVSVLALNNRSLSEISIKSGGFNAEFGNALSGIVEVSTKVGNRDRYAVSIDVESELNIDRGRLIPEELLVRKRSETFFLYGDEYYGDQKRYDYSTDYRRYRLNVSGPLPYTKTATFSISSQHVGSENGYLNRENTHDNFTESILNGKLRWQLLGNSSLTLSIGHTNRQYDLFDVRRKFIPETNQRRNSQVDQFSAVFNHPLSKKLFYNLSVAFGRTYYKAAQPGKWWDFTLDDDWNIKDGFNDSPGAIELPFEYKDSTLFIIAGDNNLFRKEDLKNYMLKWNATYQLNKYHEFKGGLELNVWDLNYQAVLAYKGFPFTFAHGIGNDDLNLPAIRPKLYAFFLQDKLEFAGFIMNAGIRYEIFDPNAKLPSDFYRPYLDPGNIGPDLSDTDYWIGPNNDIPTPNPDAPWKQASIKHFISPRAGVSHPITESSVFHFTYGHFYQIPDWYLLYRNYNYSYDILALYGNPDLEPEKTISYEVGMKQVLPKELVFDVTAFYKDISNLVETTVVNSLSDPEFIEVADADETVIRLPTWYINRNVAWGTVKGMELSLIKRPAMTGGFSMILSYTFMIARGKTSDYHDGFLRQFSRGQLEPVQQFYLNWDQRHTVSANFNYRFVDGSGLTITSNYGSGYPYTGYQESLLPVENNKRLPAVKNTDLKLNKVFKLGAVRTNLYLLVTNIFDNINIVNYDNGENRRIPVVNHLLNYSDEYQGPLDDATVYGPHREIRLGVNFDF
ncbi:MAG: TonB-dependent receptor [Candidatus Marinimicrobia bacterium]|nr:TonB-dependent receptor [Candidatus Neomarinimicrobiota bacterium]